MIKIGLKKKNIVENRWGSLWRMKDLSFILLKRTFEAVFLFYKRLFCSSARGIIFMNFLSDGCRSDQRICKQWISGQAVAFCPISSWLCITVHLYKELFWRGESWSHNKNSIVKYTFFCYMCKSSPKRHVYNLWWNDLVYLNTDANCKTIYR